MILGARHRDRVLVDGVVGNLDVLDVADDLGGVEGVSKGKAVSLRGLGRFERVKQTLFTCGQGRGVEADVHCSIDLHLLPRSGSDQSLVIDACFCSDTGVSCGIQAVNGDAVALA